MPHVGIERFGPGHGQEDRAERKEGELGIVEEELDCPMRAQRLQHFGMREDVGDPECGERGHVDEDHRTEQPAHLGGAARLDEEQTEDDADRNRDHERLKPDWTIVRPSTADRTEIAGVIIASP